MNQPSPATQALIYLSSIDGSALKLGNKFKFDVIGQGSLFWLDQ